MEGVIHDRAYSCEANLPRQLSLEADLQQAILAGQVIVVAGAGVSIGATRSRLASWRGLLESGILWCESVVPGLSVKWGNRLRSDLEDGDLDDLISVAERVASKLGAPAGGEYQRWLRDTVGSLEASDTEVIRILDSLNVPLFTTNYDELLEQVTGRRCITWRQTSEVERVIRGDSNSVVHLHGCWRDPTSVILGTKSYESILGNDHAQTMMHALRATRTFLFVGCGQGLEDPNFGAFLRWSRKVFATSEYRHYLLAAGSPSEIASLQAKHPPEEHLHVLSYGSDHRELGPFLSSVKARALPAHVAPPRPDPSGLALLIAANLLREHRPPPIPGTSRPGRDRQYLKLRLRKEISPGRERERHYEHRIKTLMENWPTTASPNDLRIDLEDALERHSNLVVLGDPGSGKTTLSLHLLSDTASRIAPESDCYLPLYFQLREASTADLVGEKPPGDALLAQVIRHAAQIANVPFAHVHQIAKKAIDGGRLLLLIDGLDEADDGARVAIRRATDALLDRLKRANRSNRAVVTCRIMSYRDPLRTADGTYEIAPFTDDDVAQFVRDHFHDAALAVGERLLVKLQEAHQRVRELTRNPLLLGLLCFYYSQREDLPERRVDLYKEMVEALLFKWRDFHGVLFAHDKERLLHLLAFTGFDHPDRPLKYEEILRIIAGQRIANRLYQAVSPELVLSEIVEGSGLLVELSPQDSYGFMHLTFQEYFVAQYVLSTDWLKVVSAHAKEIRWAEVWRLMSALMDDAFPLLEALDANGAAADTIDAAAHDSARIEQADSLLSAEYEAKQ